MLNRGAKVSIFLYRCTTSYCSIPVIYTYLGIILEASMIFICRCLHMITLWESNDDAKVHSKMGTLTKGFPFSCNFNVILSIGFYFEWAIEPKNDYQSCPTIFNCGVTLGFSVMQLTL